MLMLRNPSTSRAGTLSEAEAIERFDRSPHWVWVALDPESKVILTIDEGTNSARQWRPRTPAMAAGLTEHVWTLRAVLLFRVPPWPQLQAL
jgi:hypothetical protein